MTTSDYSLEISNLTAKYDSLDLNIPKMTFEKNKIYGLIGPNGCGKTTTLKFISGITTPTTGGIYFNQMTEKDMTMVFRTPYLINDTVYKNLIYPLKLRNIKLDKEKTDFYLELAGLSHLHKKNALSLSGGQRQKLALVRALIFSPKAILLDESFSNMDMESVAFFEEYILKSQKEQPRIWIIISHQMSSIKRLCDIVHFMNIGKLEETGTVSEIFENPKCESLKKYLQYV